jgi:hypothetical protein
MIAPEKVRDIARHASGHWHVYARSCRIAFVGLGFSAAFAVSTYAQAPLGSSARPLITQPVNNAISVPLSGNVRPEAIASNDRGLVPADLPMEHMLLQLRRSPEQEQALNALIEELHDPTSPNFHQWLSANEIGTRFGLAVSDIQTITGWLAQRGFTVNVVYPNGLLIDFSGTAGQVRNAFRTEIHYLDVNGATHFANMTDPQVPAALAPAIVGIVALHDFKPHPLYVKKPKTEYTIGGGYFFVVPADLATIYNFNPLFSAGITGAGQTIYLVESSNIFSGNDWLKFRSTFGLSSFSGASLSQIHPAPPSGSNNCANPGAVPDVDGEAILDTQWASAAAPSAAIVVAACADTNVSFGFFTAIQNLINSANPPAIISVSYGVCEANVGAAANAAINSSYQQGVAEGISIFVSSGDQNASVCDRGAQAATHGINVNAWASTQYNVAVGGTDFGDVFAGTTSTYWNANNGPTFGSAKSYVPEIPWNDTCGSVLLALAAGFTQTYGSSGFCSSAQAQQFGFLSVSGGSGGPSACATGTPSISGVGFSGTCQGYAKPSWQTGVIGIPNDGRRGVPDVSLFSAGGVSWGHAYVFCNSDPNGGSGCSGVPSGWDLAGGTSFAAPIVAGIQALINQYTGKQRQGNPNPVYYKLAAKEYGPSGNSSCNSTKGNAVANSCIFYDITLGDIDVPCLPLNGQLIHCYRPSGTVGVLSTNNNAYAPAYAATTGWDFATGLGTINAYNLVTHWSSAFSSVATHDFNGDSKSDLLWYSTANGQVLNWVISGSSVIGGGSLGSATTPWGIVGQRDFNADGKADILWRNSTTGQLLVWLVSGSSVIGGGSPGSAANPWVVAGTGDFNGDTFGDVLWYNTSTGQVVIWLLNGSLSVIGGGSPGSAGNPWALAGTGDLNGDGKQDIVWRNTSTGQVIVWFLNGGNLIGGGSLGSAPNPWTIAGTGDFNGDGFSDILWYNTTSGQAVVWLINTTSVIGGGSLGSVGSPWAIVQTGDYNGDGSTDVLWYNTTSGQAVLWFVSGTSVIGGGSPGSAASPWQLQGMNSD